MRKVVLGISILLLLPLFAHAQHGSAESGYWPMGFYGDTWTGVVSATSDATRAITLKYVKGDKTKTFTGVLEDGYTIKLKDGSPHLLKVSEIPLGIKLKVYYMAREHKVEGHKVKYYEIIRLVSVKG